MDFEIDVSGSDIFDKDYTIFVAAVNNSKVMLGHKFSYGLMQIIRARYGQKYYRYPTSKQGKVNLKLRLYCIAIYYIFKRLAKMHNLEQLNLAICRDFSGNELKIKQNLRYFLGILLGLNLEMNFVSLPKNSVADKYAFLIRHGKLPNAKKFCVEIGLSDFEKFLK